MRSVLLHVAAAQPSESVLDVCTCTVAGAVALALALALGERGAGVMGIHLSLDQADSPRRLSVDPT